MEEEIKKPVDSAEDIVIAKNEQVIPQEAAPAVEADADQHEAPVEITSEDKFTDPVSALFGNADEKINEETQEPIAEEKEMPSTDETKVSSVADTEEPSVDQPCNCCEEQKKQTSILSQISQSLKSFFDKHKKLEFVSCVVGVIGLILSCIQIYQNCKQPDLHNELNYILQEYLSIQEMQLYRLDDSLSVHPEVKVLYATHRRIEILRKDLRNYPTKIGKMGEMSLSTKNMLEYFTEADRYSDWDCSISSNVTKLQEFAKTYRLMCAFDEDISRKFDESIMDEYIKCGEARIKVQEEYNNKLSLVRISLQANAHLSNDYKVRKKFQKRIEDLDEASARLFDIGIQTNYYKSILGWLTVLDEIVDCRLRKIGVESLEGKYKPSEFEASSLLQEYIFKLNQDKE